MIEFELSPEDVTQRAAGRIPPAATLRGYGGALTLFTFSNGAEEMSWGEFISLLRDGAPEQADVTVRAFERVFDSAVSPMPI